MTTDQTRSAVVTGSSRGVGEATAKLLGAAGIHVFVTYRNKAKRAEKVAEAIVAAGGAATPVQLDVTDAASREALADAVRDSGTQLAYLVLNASGGLERDAAEDYAMVLNRDSQVAMVREFEPLLAADGKVTFVTSHQAHFFPDFPHPDMYTPVAESKHAGERAVSDAAAELGRKLLIVSGDLIEGTVTATMLDRAYDGIIARRKEQAGGIPTVQSFAEAISEATLDPERTETVYVGSTEF
jgi:3-oxoacyl-[acyl-carrier protein] reductase